MRQVRKGKDHIASNFRQIFYFSFLRHNLRVHMFMLTDEETMQLQTSKYKYQKCKVLSLRKERTFLHTAKRRKGERKPMTRVCPRLGEIKIAVLNLKGSRRLVLAARLRDGSDK